MRAPPDADPGQLLPMHHIHTDKPMLSVPFREFALGMVSGRFTKDT